MSFEVKIKGVNLRFMRKQLSTMNLFKTALILFWLVCSTIFAQFSLNNGTLLTSGNFSNASGLDTIFVVSNFNNVILQYTSADSTDFSWSRFSIDNGSVTTPALIPSSIVSNKRITTLSVSEPGGFELEIGPVGGSIRKYIWITDYEEHTPVVDSVVIYDSKIHSADSCNHIIAEAYSSSDSIYIGDVVNDQVVVLERDQNITWTTDPTITIGDHSFRTHLYPPNIPYEDTRFTATVYESLFYNGSEFNTTAENDTLYVPVAVKISDIIATIIERDNNNEFEKAEVNEVRGSAPLNVNFSTKGTNSKVDFYDWEILAMAESDSQRVTFTEDSFRYVFRNDINSEQETDYSVRVTVSNDYCSASANEDVTIVSSFLDAANILVIGFGASEDAQQFKVVYKSIKPESFRGAIYNRWGRRVFSWTDPELGWDGRYNGRYVSPGVYYYVISAEGTDGEKWEIKRDLNVLRPKDIK